MSSIMNRKEQIRDLMQRIYTAHQEFATAWEASKAANFNNGQPYDIAKLNQKEIDTMLEANHRAYVDARPQEETLYALLREFFDNHLNPLMPAFEVGDSLAIDGILDFVEIDIPAFKLGYEKEYIYGKLKHLSLNESQSNRLRQVAFNLCSRPHYRREINELGRLMIRLADEQFVEELRNLSGSSNEYVQKKAKRMLDVILQGRKDLRKEKMSSI